MPPAKRTKAELLRASASNASKRTPAARAPPPGPPLPVTASQQGLPRQILADIVSHLDPLHFEDFCTLRLLCLTSKPFRTVARPAMYRVFPVYDRRDEEHAMYFRTVAALKQHRVVQPTAHETDSRVLDRVAERLLHALEADKARAALVQEIVFYGTIPGEYTADAMRRILETCINVRAIRLLEQDPSDIFFFSHKKRRSGYDSDEDDREMGPVAFKVVHELCPQVKRLEVVGIHPADQGSALSLLAPFTDLEHLEVKYSQYDQVTLDWMDPDFGQVAGVEFTWRLKSLDLPNSISQAMLDRLAVSSVDTLANLSVAVRAEALDLGAFTRVARLTIAFSRPTVVAATLATAPSSVRTLELRQDGDLAYLDEQEERWSRQDEEDAYDSDGDFIGPTAAEIDARPYKHLFAAVPDTITRLMVPFYLVRARNEEQDLLAALATPGWAPRLVVLDVADEALMDMPLMDEQGGEDLADAQAARERVRNACERRGVRLGGVNRHWTEGRRSEGQLPRAAV